MIKGEIIMTLSAKLLEVQKSIEKTVKSSQNPHFRSNYADLNEVLAVSKAALHKQGLFIVQAPGKDQFGPFLETSIIDSESDQQIGGRIYFSGTEDNLQKIGAAITYARRFLLKSLLAMEDTDDDGETAVGRPQQPKQDSAPGKPSPVKAAPAPVQDVRGVPGQPAKALPEGPGAREKLNEKISLASKVLVDSKRATLEELQGLLKSFNVSKKEELSDKDAEALHAKLKEKLK